jgi:hypothetical protein
MQRTFGLFALCLLCALWGNAVASDEDVDVAWGREEPGELLQFDVVENTKRFKFDETPLNAEGKPAYGNEFITEGFIYPYGFLDDKDGVDADGKPTHPEQVIGRWTCRGWHVGRGAATQKGPWVITHQLFNFSQRPGAETLATDGLERVDAVPIKRAIIGGTGRYKTARGEAIQTMLGFTATEGVKLRFELHIDTGK